MPVAESQQADTVWHISALLAAAMAFGCISSLTHCYGTTAPDTLVPVFRPNYFPLSYLRHGKKNPNNQVQGEQRETKVVVPVILELHL